MSVEIPVVFNSDGGVVFNLQEILEPFRHPFTMLYSRSTRVSNIHKVIRSRSLTSIFSITILYSSADDL